MSVPYETTVDDPFTKLICRVRTLSETYPDVAKAGSAVRNVSTDLRFLSLKWEQEITHVQLQIVRDVQRMLTELETVPASAEALRSQFSLYHATLFKYCVALSSTLLQGKFRQSQHDAKPVGGADDEGSRVTLTSILGPKSESAEPKGVSKSKALSEHLETHKTYGCQFCGTTFMQHRDLRRHLMVVHDEERLHRYHPLECYDLNCAEYKNVFQTEDQLLGHVQTVHVNQALGIGLDGEDEALLSAWQRSEAQGHSVPTQPNVDSAESGPPTRQLASLAWDNESEVTRSTTSNYNHDATSQSYSTKPTATVLTQPTSVSQSLRKHQILPDLEKAYQTPGNGEEQDDDGYSDAGSIAIYEDGYATVLQNELLQDLLQCDPAAIDMPTLSPLLQEFAIRIGHQEEGYTSRNMMYFAHKLSREIATRVCERRTDAIVDGSACSDESGRNRGPEGSAYYTDAQNIENWNMGSEGGVTEIYEPLIDPWDAQLSLGHKDLRNSEAYKWLVHATKRTIDMKGIQPIHMEAHRNWLLDMLEANTPPEQASIYRKISRRRKPGLFTVNLDLAWNLKGFLEDQEYAGQDLHGIIGRVITLSGDGESVQALSCKDYMEKVWPLTGVEFVHFLELLVDKPGQVQTYLRSDKTEVSATLRGDSASFKITGTTYGVAEVVEQLLWASTALQTLPDAPHMSLNVAEPHMTSFVVDNYQIGQKTDVPQAPHVGTAHCVVNFTHEPLVLVMPSHKGQCWHNLFRHCVIVSGYPISSRPAQRPGLEIPLDMMAALANAERLTPFGDNMVIKGFATALFPTMYEDQCVFWHLVHNEDGSRISFADDRIFVSVEDRLALKQLQPENMSRIRHIVGWAAEIRNNTGTASANYDLKWSALKRPCPGFALEKIQINAGLYITAGTTFGRGKRDKAIHICSNDYVSSLRSIGDKFVILHDLEIRKAWLVDGLSALLHLVRASLHHAFQSDYGCLSKPENLEAKSSDGGRKKAYDALLSSSNLNLPIHEKVDFMQGEELPGDEAKFYNVRDTVRDILHLLEQTLDHQADSQEGRVGYRIRRAPWAQLEGFDFMDIATKSKIIHPRATELCADGEGWYDLTRKIHAVTLFGKGFGELLEPILRTAAQDRCTKCLWNSKVPAGRDLLAVSISELERIVERRGTKSEDRWQLVDDYYLHVTPALFSTCSSSKDQSCQRARVRRVREQSQSEHEQAVVQSNNPTGWKRFILKLNQRFDRTNGITKTAPLPLPTQPIDIASGGILLGMEPTLFKKVTQPLKGGKPQPIRQPSTSLHASLQTSNAQLLPTSTSSQNSRQDSSVTNQLSSQTTSVQLGTEATSLTGQSSSHKSDSTLPGVASTAGMCKQPNHALKENGKGKARVID